MKKVLYTIAQKALAIGLLAITVYYSYIAQEAGALLVITPISAILFLIKENMFEEIEENFNARKNNSEH